MVLIHVRCENQPNTISSEGPADELWVIYDIY